MCNVSKDFSVDCYSIDVDNILDILTYLMKRTDVRYKIIKLIKQVLIASLNLK